MVMLGSWEATWGGCIGLCFVGGFLVHDGARVAKCFTFFVLRSSVQVLDH